MCRLIYISLFVIAVSSCVKDKSKEPVVNEEPVTIDCSTISYSDVDMIFKAHCAPCHTGAGNSGSINVENYSNASSAAAQSRFLESLTQEPSSFATPMPPSGKLPDSTIQKIECWINEGFPN